MKPYYTDSRVTMYHGDALTVLMALPDESVQMCVTSPPYWGLRDYQTQGQLGLESTPEAYVATMVEVFCEVRRILRQDGTLWLNIGDSYAAGKTGRDDNSGPDLARRAETYGSGTGNGRGPSIGIPRPAPPGLKPKDLVGIPWRLAFALQADGWWLRSDIIWSKPNPMPESVTDRPTKAHEYIFLLTKSATYYYDAEAIKEPLTVDYGSEAAYHQRIGNASYHTGNSDPKGGGYRGEGGFRTGTLPLGRNRRTVWEITTQPFPDAHFATFPPKLIEPCVLAGTSEQGCCATCGAPRERVVERQRDGESLANPAKINHTAGRRTCRRLGPDVADISTTLGWQAGCACDADPVPCTVLDPFAGAGTALMVAKNMNRRAIGIDLNAAYLDLAIPRVAQEVLL